MDIVNILTRYTKQKTSCATSVRIWHGIENALFELTIEDSTVTRLIGWINNKENKFTPYSWPNLKGSRELNIADPDFFRKFDIVLDFERYYDRSSERIQELYYPLDHDPHFPSPVLPIYDTSKHSAV